MDAPMLEEITTRDPSPMAARTAEARAPRLPAPSAPAERLKATPHLVGEMAHDLSNLLAVIIGHAELVAESEKLSGSLVGDVEEIRRSALRARALLQGVLAFARGRPLVPGGTSLSDSLERLVPLLRWTLGSQIELVVRTHPEVDRCQMEELQFELLLLNLALNARDAMPQGGRLTLVTSPGAARERDLAPTEEDRPGRGVLLTVADTGCGMDAQTLSRACEPFFTTKAPGTGTGLGLSSARSAVEQCGGHLSLESEPGRGTTVRIYLPCAREVRNHR